MNTEALDFLQNLSPLEKFQQWFSEAQKQNLKQPTAMVISTLGEDGFPHSRVVLLKEIRSASLVFYTNYQSTKAKDLANNPKCSLNFYWDPLFRQVKMLGSVKQLSRDESVSYWNSRPRESQISGYVSAQSRPVESRSIMEAEWSKTDLLFKNKSIPCPDQWGGYQFSPIQFEFWIGREGRFHDRFMFRLDKGLWQPSRLYP